MTWLKQNWFKVALLLVVSLSATAYLSSEQIDALAVPLLQLNIKDTGQRLVVSGMGYPKATISVYVDGRFATTALVDKQGRFAGEVVFVQEGTQTITTTQSYKGVVSPSSQGYILSVDLTAPTASDFHLGSVPALATSSTIEITGTSTPGYSVILNGLPYLVGLTGAFNISHTLAQGTNTLVFYLRDSAGNESSELARKNIYVDTLPPKISNYCLGRLATMKPIEEEVCIRIGDWTGYLESYNSVALVGSVRGEIRFITVDGKRVSWDENKEIYQRVSLFIHGGLNRYRVTVEDMAGNVSTGYVETNAERTQDSINVNVND